jgi:hypothetical protein
MKITKYEVHVHSIEDLDNEIAGKYFICGNESRKTIKRAIISSDDKTFQKYFNNQNYVIHVIKQEISKDEEKIFNEMAKNDNDPENFFTSQNK